MEDSNVLSRQWEEYRRFMFLSGKPGSGKTAVLLKCAYVEEASPVVSCTFLVFVNSRPLIVSYLHVVFGLLFCSLVVWIHVLSTSRKT